MDMSSSHTPTTQINTLSLHDALPICSCMATASSLRRSPSWARPRASSRLMPASNRSEEHTSELQSRPHLVCRLLLEKKNELVQRVWLYTVGRSRRCHGILAGTSGHLT